MTGIHLCPYCGKRTDLVTGAVIYPHRPDLSTKNFYRCEPCDAYVGCHPGTTKALGPLANAELRRARSNAHAAFDPLWRSGKMSRSRAYTILAEKLGIPKERCHIGMFGVEDCQRVIEVLQR